MQVYQSHAFLNYATGPPKLFQLSEKELAGEGWTTKTNRTFSLLPRTSAIFTINKEDSSWHFNLSDHNLNQPIENSCFIIYDSDLHTVRPRRQAIRNGKNFAEGYVLHSMTSLALEKGRLRQREIFLDKGASEL